MKTATKRARKVPSSDKKSEVVLTKPQLALVSDVVQGGYEFKKYHQKLKTLFSKEFIHKVKRLKDEVFEVHTGSQGKKVPVMDDDGERMMHWRDFVAFAFGVSDHRLREIMNPALDAFRGEDLDDALKEKPAPHKPNGKPHEPVDRAAIDLNNDKEFKKIKGKGVIAVKSGKPGRGCPLVRRK